PRFRAPEGDPLSAFRGPRVEIEVEAEVIPARQHVVGQTEIAVVCGQCVLPGMSERAYRADWYGVHMAGEYIFTMYQLKKIVPPQREVLKGITLAFYPDAKIGVLGPNGAGKSTLLRIMAGVDTDFIGDARLMEGRRAGLLAQEPQLDASKDVRG